MLDESEPDKLEWQIQNSNYIIFFLGKFVRIKETFFASDVFIIRISGESSLFVGLIMDKIAYEFICMNNNYCDL